MFYVLYGVHHSGQGEQHHHDVEVLSQPRTSQAFDDSLAPIPASVLYGNHHAQAPDGRANRQDGRQPGGLGPDDFMDVSLDDEAAWHTAWRPPGTRDGGGGDGPSGHASGGKDGLVGDGQSQGVLRGQVPSPPSESPLPQVGGRRSTTWHSVSSEKAWEYTPELGRGSVWATMKGWLGLGRSRQDCSRHILGRLRMSDATGAEGSSIEGFVAGMSPRSCEEPISGRVYGGGGLSIMHVGGGYRHPVVPSPRHTPQTPHRPSAGAAGRLQEGGSQVRAVPEHPHPNHKDSQQGTYGLLEPGPAGEAGGSGTALLRPLQGTGELGSRQGPARDEQQRSERAATTDHATGRGEGLGRSGVTQGGGAGAVAGGAEGEEGSMDVVALGDDGGGVPAGGPQEVPETVLGPAGGRRAERYGAGLSSETDDRKDAEDGRGRGSGSGGLDDEEARVVDRS